MGGSGGGTRRPIDSSQLRRLEQIAREELADTSATGRRNVFISFVSEDLAEVNLLRGQAKNENCDLEFNDWSLQEPFDSEQAEYIRRGIRERIRQSSVTVVYVSDTTADSAWVNWEIRESAAMGKQVIALHKGETPPRRLPAALVEIGVKPIRWSTKEITDAICSE